MASSVAILTDKLLYNQLIVLEKVETWTLRCFYRSLCFTVRFAALVVKFPRFSLHGFIYAP